MRKFALIFLTISLSYSLPLSAVQTRQKKDPSISHLSSLIHIDSFSLAPYPPHKQKPENSIHNITPDSSSTAIPETAPQIKTNFMEFSLNQETSSFYNFKLPSYPSPYTQISKYYARAFLDISGINLAVWSFDKFILKKEWAQISVDSVIQNLNNGFEWDRGTFISNQLAHPYHGAMYHSAARLNGLNIWESTFYTAAGSLMWELFFESNYPSFNDTLMTTLGGVMLGGPLHQIAGWLWNQNPGGIKGIFQKSLTLLFNPSFSYQLFPNKNKGLNLFPDSPHYNFHFPIGTYWSETKEQKYLLGISVENTSYLENDLSELKPYDWFLLDCRLGFHKNKLRDKEIFTTTILNAQKTEYGLSGLFGVYDYIDTQTIDMLSAAGIGVGAVSNFNSAPDFFTNASGVLSVILGGSSPSFERENYWFGQKNQRPYYFGPGLMYRFRIEVGKQRFGSILAKFSQYWINSLFSDAQESLSISSFNFKLNVTQNSQINIGYDCYIRQGTFLEKNTAANKDTVKIFYIHKF